MSVEEAARLLNEAIRSGLKREAEQPKIGVYRPSLLGSCLLRQFMIYKYGLPVSDEKAGVFKIGDLFHDFLSGALEASSIEVKRVEAPFQIVLPHKGEFIRITGRADIIAAVNGEEYVIEVKSIRKLPEKPLNHHIQQLTLYMAGHDVERGFIIYLEKQALHHRIFPVEFSQEKFRDLLERAVELHNALIKDDAPKSDPEPWECRYCEFNGQTCGETRGRGTP